jgi:hypothetical protein
MVGEKTVENGSVLVNMGTQTGLMNKVKCTNARRRFHRAEFSRHFLIWNRCEQAGDDASSLAAFGAERVVHVDPMANKRRRIFVGFAAGTVAHHVGQTENAVFGRRRCGSHRAGHWVNLGTAQFGPGRAFHLAGPPDRTGRNHRQGGVCRAVAHIRDMESRTPGAGTGEGQGFGGGRSEANQPMSLMVHLLTVGRSLKSGKDKPSPFRMKQPILLPKFGPRVRSDLLQPANAAKAAESRADQSECAGGDTDAPPEARVEQNQCAGENAEAPPVTKPGVLRNLSAVLSALRVKRGSMIQEELSLEGVRVKRNDLLERGQLQVSRSNPFRSKQTITVAGHWWTRLNERLFAARRKQD